MRETLASIWAWTRIAAFSLVCLWGALVLILNRNATIEPGLQLIVVRYDHPPALVVLIMTAVVSVVGLVLVWGFYRAVLSVRESRERRNQLKGASGSTDVRIEETPRRPGPTVTPSPSVMRKPEDREPIPLEPPRPGT